MNSSIKFWRHRPVLVTGGAGFIGSWLCHDLSKLGAKTIIIDIKKKMPPLGKQPDTVLRNVVFIHGNILNKKLLESILEKFKIETVFHLAAESIVGKASKNPEKALDVNVKGTWQVLSAFRNICGDGGQIVVASSDKAYGTHALLPYKETHALLGENPYDCSKSCADRIANMYAKTYGIPVCIARCGNVYGGGDFNFSRLIPDAIRCLFFNKPFRIRSNGLFKRDYIFINDIVHAYICTAETMGEKKLAGEVFNFGNNKPLSVLNVVKHIVKAMGKPNAKPIILATTRHEIQDQYLDSSKAIKILNWKPLYGFEKGLRETILWYKNFFSKYGAQKF